ncbi:MAG: nucleotidyl transferase AbiEii/AbiGii toxin family protein [Candidatus Moranbacteria bacterium]|jgi:hypothetical protein|nr:nucleotidyl transferase AbiEii/AbiGii toxin family protein [Candidatus Moranbacteria bacterium]
MLHDEILNEEQKKLLPFLGVFRDDFGMVGGTAIALHIGHRESIDFDLFSVGPIGTDAIRRKLAGSGSELRAMIDTPDEYTVLVGDVKMTFLRYPFPIEFPIPFGDVANLPDVLTLAAMKAYALGRRAKWKDYVDLYFIMKDRHTIGEIAGKASELFGGEFNEKIFRAQLAYFEDIDHSEKVVFMPGFETDESVIKDFLVQVSIS